MFVHGCAWFAHGLRNVCAWFAQYLRVVCAMFAHALHIVCANRKMFTHGLRMVVHDCAMVAIVCATFTLRLRKVRTVYT